MHRKRATHLTLLDGVRLFAFSWTVALHTEAMLFLAAPIGLVQKHYEQGAKRFGHRLVFWQGHFALDIFMLLSGFLFSAGYANQEKAPLLRGLLSCIARRLKRLAPLYYLVLSVHLLTPAPRKENAWRAFLFLSNTVSVEQQYLPHAWSVSLDVQATVALYLLHSWAALHPQRDNSTEGAPDLRSRTSRLAVATVTFVFCGVGVSSWLVYGEHQLRLPLKVLGHEAFSNPDVLFPPAYQAFYRLVYLSLPVRLPAYLIGSVLWHAKHATGTRLSCGLSKAHKLGLSLLAAALWFACLALPFSASPDVEDFSRATSVMVAALARPAAALATAVILYAWLPSVEQRHRSHRLQTNASVVGAHGTCGALAGCMVWSEEVLEKVVREGNRATQRSSELDLTGIGVTRVGEQKQIEAKACCVAELSWLSRLAAWFERVTTKLASLCYLAYLIHVSIVGGMLIGFRKEAYSSKDLLRDNIENLSWLLTLVSSTGLVLSIVGASLLLSFNR